MPLFTTLTALSQTPGANPPDGGSDAPSSIDDNLRLLGSFGALLRDAAHVYVSSIAGANTITGNIATTPTSYTVGQVYRFVAAAANTGAVTLNFNSIGAKNLLKVGNVALTGGELNSTSVYEAVYDGVSFQLVGMYGFKNSKATNGYQYLPSGVLMQWGTATASAAGSATATFPVAFINQASSIVITPIAAPAFASLDNGALGTFQFSLYNIAGARVGTTANWLAIGY